MGLSASLKPLIPPFVKALQTNIAMGLHPQCYNLCLFPNHCLLLGRGGGEGERLSWMAMEVWEVTVWKEDALIHRPDFNFFTCSARMGSA